MGKEIKTTEQWLNELPEPYRTRAIENTLKQGDVYDLKTGQPSLKITLMSAFIWRDSEQGHEYWENLCNTL